MTATEVLRYTRGDELETLGLTWPKQDGTLWNFTTGWTFRARIGTGSGFLVEKTTGFTGAATAPNLQLNFTAGELDGVASGTYHLDIQATLTATSQTITRTWLFQVLAGVGTDTLPQSPSSLAVLGNLSVGGDLTVVGELIGFPELVAGLAVVLTPGGSPPAETVTVAVNLIDEDDMASNSDVRPPSQQSVKAYVDGKTQTVARTSDLVRNNTSTLANDTQLTLPVVANAVYEFDALVVYTATATADFKIGISAPTGATAWWNTETLDATPSTGGTGGVDRRARSITETGVGRGIGTAAGDKLLVTSNGYLTVAGTAGNLAIQWAQSVAEVSDTTVYTNSRLMIRRIA